MMISAPTVAWPTGSDTGRIRPEVPGCDDHSPDAGECTATGGPGRAAECYDSASGCPGRSFKRRRPATPRRTRRDAGRHWPGTRPSRAGWSGREDLNLRLHGPEPCALPGCATPRCRRAHWTECRSGLPGVLSDELHELAVTVIARAQLAADVVHHGEGLVGGVPDRDDDAAPCRQLVNERRRDAGPAGRDQDP